MTFPFCPLCRYTCVSRLFPRHLQYFLIWHLFSWICSLIAHPAVHRRQSQRQIQAEDSSLISLSSYINLFFTSQKRVYTFHRCHTETIDTVCCAQQRNPTNPKGFYAISDLSDFLLSEKSGRFLSKYLFTMNSERR